MKYLFFTAALFLAGMAGNAFSKHTPTTDEVISVTKVNPVSTVNTLTPINPKISHKSILKVKADQSRVIYLTEQVTQETAQTLVNQIKTLNEVSSAPIWMKIDSPGGSVLDGASVISEMEASRAPVYTVCTRLCASMAAMIHSYGTKRYAADRAILMYHPASGQAEGQIPDMVSQLTAINRYTEKMVTNVVLRSHFSKEEYDHLVAYQIWIDAEDAEAKGLTDGTINLSGPNYPPASLTFSPAPNETKSPPPFYIKSISPNLELWKR